MSLLLLFRQPATVSRAATFDAAGSIAVGDTVRDLHRGAALGGTGAIVVADTTRDVRRAVAIGTSCAITVTDTTRDVRRSALLGANVDIGTSEVVERRRAVAVVGVAGIAASGVRMVSRSAAIGAAGAIAASGRRSSFLETTMAAIRDHAIALVYELEPQLASELRFVPYRNEGNGNFESWATGHAAGCTRRYQVRTSRVTSPPDVSSTAREAAAFVLEVRVAYAHTAHFGPGQARDRHDAIAGDMHQIEHAIGVRGFENFDGITTPRGDWTEATSQRVRLGNIDMLVIRQTMRYRRDAVLT